MVSIHIEFPGCTSYLPLFLSFPCLLFHKRYHLSLPVSKISNKSPISSSWNRSQQSTYPNPEPTPPSEIFLTLGEQKSAQVAYGNETATQPQVHSTNYHMYPKSAGFHPRNFRRIRRSTPPLEAYSVSLKFLSSGWRIAVTPWFLGKF